VGDKVKQLLCGTRTPNLKLVSTITNLISKNFATLILTLVSAIYGLNVNADTIELNKVEVSEPKQTLTAADLRIFTNDEFSGKYVDLSDFINNVNGLQVLQSGGKGNPALVSIQGASSQQTTLLLNGSQVNSSQSGSYNLNIVPISQIERIEISTSGQANSTTNAIGGTINIITKTKIGSEVQTNISSFGGYSLGYNSSFSKNSHILVNHEVSKNDYSFLVGSPIGDSQNPKTQNLNNAKYSRQHIQLSNHNIYLNSIIQLHNQKKEIPQYSRNNPENNAFLKDKGISIDFQGSIPNQSSWGHYWKTFYRYQDEHFQDSEGVIGLGENNNHYYSSRSEALWRTTYNNLEWQPYFETIIFEETYLSNYLDDNDSRTCSTLQGNCDQVAFQVGMQNNLSITKQNRTQDKQLILQLTNHQTDNSNRTRNNQVKTDKSLNSLGHLVKYSHYYDSIDFHLSHKGAVRNPTLFELFGDRGLSLSNEDLLQEESQTFALDILWTGTGSYSATVNFFNRDLKNAITPVYDSRGVGRYENTNKALMSGLEWEWRAVKPENSYTLLTNVNGSYYQSNTSSVSVKSFDHKKLAGIYHQNLKLSSAIQFGSHHLTLQYQFSDDIYIDRSNTVKGDQRLILNINYLYSQINLKTGFRIQNILDNEYNDFTNRPAVGRQWHLFLNYTL